MKREDFEAALASQGYAPAVLMQQPIGYAMDVHQHPFDAFALITQGEITIEVDGVSSSYSAGTTFQLPANTPHKESALLQGVSYLAGRRSVNQDVNEGVNEWVRAS
jgi:mannose-6-phosphate isomerase-like protein (cupin superfamily)